MAEQSRTATPLDVLTRVINVNWFDERLYTCGFSHVTIVPVPIRITRLDPDTGEVIWEKEVGEVVGAGAVPDFIVDPSNNIYISTINTPAKFYKLDEEGNLVWEQTNLFGVHPVSEFPAGIPRFMLRLAWAGTHPITNREMLVCGLFGGEAGPTVAAVYADTGEIVWTSRALGIFQEYCFGIASNGEEIIAVLTGAPEEALPWSHTYAIGVSKETGNTTWTQTVQLGSDDASIAAEDASMDASGNGYAIYTGEGTTPTPDIDNVKKYSKQGGGMWSKGYNYPRNTQIANLALRSDCSWEEDSDGKKFVITTARSANNQDSYHLQNVPTLHKLNAASGGVVWEKSGSQDANQYSQFYDCVILENGSTVAVTGGRYVTIEPQFDAVWRTLCYNANGQLLWSRTDTPGNGQSPAQLVARTARSI